MVHPLPNNNLRHIEKQQQQQQQPTAHRKTTTTTTTIPTNLMSPKTRGTQRHVHQKNHKSVAYQKVQRTKRHDTMEILLA